MHVEHKLATSYCISRPDGTLCTLAEVDEEKDLGVILTNDLNAERQYREAARKTMNVLRTRKRHFMSNFLPSCMECRRGLNLSVRVSVRLSVCHTRAL